MIYLDNAATTKPLKELKDLFFEYAETGWYNPSARYAPAARQSAAGGRKYSMERVRTRMTAAVSSASILRVRSGAATFRAFSDPRDSMAKKSGIPRFPIHGARKIHAA